MALNYNQIRDDMALAIAENLAGAASDSLASLPVAALGIPATWPGGVGVSATVICPDTSQVVAGNYVKQNAAGNWYLVQSVIDDVSFVVTDPYAIGSYPSGGSPSILPQTLIWDGTNTVIATNTSGIEAGDSIRLDVDGQFFFVLQVETGVSILIADGDLTIPSGSTPSSIANSSRTTMVLPPPPDSASLVETAGEPIAFGVMDTSFIPIAGVPLEFPGFSVAQLPGISNPALGAQVFVTDATGGSIPAFWDGSDWRRVDTRVIVT